MKRKFETLSSALFIVISAALAWLAYSYGGMDFNVYYAAARVTLQGGNPYDYAQLAPQIISVGKLNNPYYYAPWFTWSVMPFALFPYNIARVLWAAIHFILWVFSLINLSKIIPYPPAGNAKWSAWLLATFLFAWSAWGAEQVGVLILFFFTLILISAQKENWKVTGILLALILFKPNITALPAAFIALWLLLRKKTWQPLLIMGATLALLLSIQFLLAPKFYLPLFNPDKIQGLSFTLNASGGLEIKRYTATLRDFLSVYGIQGGDFALLYGWAILAGVAALFYGLKFSASLAEFSALALLVNFALIPYALFYDYPALTLTLFYGNQLTLKHQWMRYAANALMVVSLFIGNIIPYRYWMILILAALLMFGFYGAARKDQMPSS